MIKKITNGYLHGNVFTPDDELAIFNKNDYNNIFQNLEQIVFIKN